MNVKQLWQRHKQDFEAANTARQERERSKETTDEILNELRKKIEEGQSTGDKLLDYALLFAESTHVSGFYKRIKEDQEMLQAATGELVLIANYECVHTVARLIGESEYGIGIIGQNGFLVSDDRRLMSVSTVRSVRWSIGSGLLSEIHPVLHDGPTPISAHIAYGLIAGNSNVRQHVELMPKWCSELAKRASELLK